MRIAMIGAGAMGSMFGARFATAGAEVVLYDLDEASVAAVTADGLAVATPTGDIHVRVAATGDPLAIGGVDFAVVLVDSNATATAARTIAMALPPQAYALTLQNGIGNVETLVAALGRTASSPAPPTTAPPGSAPARCFIRMSARRPSASSTGRCRTGSPPSPTSSAGPACQSRSATTSSAMSG